jgi:hypothetical protein
MEEFVEQELTDAQALSTMLPGALEEMVIKFTFKSNNTIIFATLDPEIIVLDDTLPASRQDFMWVFDCDNYKWIELDLADIRDAIDIESMHEGFVEEEVSSDQVHDVKDSLEFVTHSSITKAGS